MNHAANNTNGKQANARLNQPVNRNGSQERYTLITGGAGFIGSNVADRLLRFETAPGRLHEGADHHVNP